MRHFSLVLIISVVAVALPLQDSLSDTIMGSVGSVLGALKSNNDNNSKAHDSKCQPRRSEQNLEPCITGCLSECLGGSSACNTCIRGCYKPYACDQDGGNDTARNSTTSNAGKSA
ncbi:hypothetical protein AAE478_009523 [Parahypoxylon ruwenzoriense]